MKKILILTAAFGDGHNTAARNIRDALEHICNDVKVEVLDLFEASYGPFNTLAKKTYLGIVQYAPRLWESVYSRRPLPIARASGRNGFKIGARTAMSARSWHPIEFARTRLSALPFRVS